MTDDLTNVNPFQIAFEMHMISSHTVLSLQEKLSIYRESDSVLLFQALETEMNMLPADEYNITRAIFRRLLILYPLLNKEYNRNDSYIKARIELYATTKLLRLGHSGNFIEINTILSSSLRFLESFDTSNPTHNPYTARCEEQINFLTEYLFNAMALLMDLYCLCRIFKKFQVKVGCQPTQAYNIIIYAGQAHSEVYGEFIESYFRIPDVNSQIMPPPLSNPPVFSSDTPLPGPFGRSCVAIDLTRPTNSIIVP
jgi:hypothetical protein